MPKELDLNTHFPAEWDEQEAIIIGFPSHAALWSGNLLLEAQKEVAALCNTLCEAQKCYVLVANEAAESMAKSLLSDNVEIIAFNFGDIWFRDISPIFRNKLKGVRFKHNGWGEKYLYPFDDCAASRLQNLFDLDCDAFDFVLEGGALDHNGDGAILTTKQCILNKNRNAWGQDEAEKKLLSVFNARKVYWLEHGLAYDHTDGHIDNAARFVASDKVLFQHSNGSDDPNTNIYTSHQNELLVQGLNAISIPSPGLIRGPQSEVMPASHLNFVITNDKVVFPNYLKYRFADKSCVDATAESLKELFPDREIVTLASNALLTGGGSFHCISQHIPV